MTLQISHTRNPLLLNECAHLMSTSEPWITLKRNYGECRQSVEGDFREVFVATEDQKLIGFVVLQMKGTFSGYLQSICVSPEKRDKGIGKNLLRFAEDFVFKISPNIFLCVSDFNSGAIKLYEQSGYERIGVLKDFVAIGFDEILMRKTVGSWNEFKK